MHRYWGFFRHGPSYDKILVDLGAKVYAIARRDSGEELMVDYCDNAMKKIGQKEELCRFPALPSDEELAKFHAQNNN